MMAGTFSQIHIQIVFAVNLNGWNNTDINLWG